MEWVEIVSKRARRRQEYMEADGYMLVDVTSRSEIEAHRKFSPFYPHGGIPVPGRDGVTSCSVEGVWQGLKVFAGEGVDEKKFKISTMKNLKRPVTEARGRVMGHMLGAEVLGYVEARKQIYVPTYEYMLDTFMTDELKRLAAWVAHNDTKIAFLDYETNYVVENTYSPLSHASIIIRRLETYVEELKNIE